MRTYSIQITGPAEKDLKEIVNYIAKELLEPKAARNILNIIANKIISLEDMPYRNGLVSDLRLANKGIRKIIVKNNIIFYIVEEERKTVAIIRILYNKRNWKYLL